MTLRMHSQSYLTADDSVYAQNLPEGAGAYAGYVDGRWPDFAAVKKRFPRAHLLSIAVFASDDAGCLDIENGDGTPAQAPPWVRRQERHGSERPVLYASAGRMNEVWQRLSDAGIARTSVRLWSAHYGAGVHICGPGTCKLVDVDCDGTQWTDGQPGVNGTRVDESVLRDDFFPARVVTWRANGLERFAGVARRRHTTPERMVQLAADRGHVYDRSVQRIIDRQEWGRRLPRGTLLFAPER